MKIFLLNFLSKSLQLVGNVFIFLSRSVYFFEPKKKYLSWFKNNGDQTLRLEYQELNKNSIVFDVGGYVGQWASDIYSMYTCKIFIFEPVSEYAKRIKQRFIKNKNIQLFNFGLSGENKTEYIYRKNDSSSLFKKDGKPEAVKLIKLSSFLDKYNINKIDLIKINIEGGEYELLEDIISSDYIKRINNIQVQFHDFIPNAENRMKEIQKSLRKTHRLTYSYPFIWENWEMNK